MKDICIEVKNMNEDWRERFLDHLERVTEEMEQMKREFMKKSDELGQTDNKEAGEYLQNTSKWVEVEGLYRLAATIDQYMGYENVVLDIFRYNTDDVPFNP